MPVLVPPAVRNSPTRAVYLTTAVAFLTVAILRYLLDPILGDSHPYILFIFPALSVAGRIGWKPGAAGLLFGMVVANFLFATPRMSFRVEAPENQIGLLIYLAVGGAGVYLADGRRAAQLRSEHNAAVARAEADAHRQTQEALRKQQARLLDHTPDPILTWEHGHAITYWNAGAESLYGFSADEAIGRSGHELLHTVFPDGRDAFEAALLRDGRWEGELRHQTKDGRWVTTDSRMAVVAGADGVRTVLEANRDVTGQRRAEASERDALERVRGVVEQAVDGIVTIDEWGTVETVNPAVVRMFGYTQDEVVGRNISRLMPEPFRSGHDGYLAEYVRTGKAKVIGIGREVRGRRKDGTEFPLDLSVSEVRLGSGRLFTGIVRDISERKQAEEARARLAAIVESSADAIISKTLDGVIRTWNAGAERLFGYTAAEAVGQPVTLIVPPDLLDEERSILDHLRRGERVEHRDTVRVTKGGRSVDVSLTVSPLFDANGRVIGASKVARDITDRKRAERRLLVQHAVVSILAEAEDLRAAAPKLLQALCEATGWDAGDLWAKSREAHVLSCVAFWPSEREDLWEFSEMSVHSAFAPGVGLPGRVWAARVPVWIANLAAEPNFPRAAVAERAGLRSGFGFPAQFGSEVLGVAEFFSRGTDQPDDGMLRLFATLGSQIGQFIERKRSEGGLRLFRTLIDRTTDGIEVVDPKTGRFLDVNERTCTAHGYTREEHLGLSVVDVDPVIRSATWGAMFKDGRLSGSQTFESIHQRKDGSTFPVEVNFTNISLDRDYIVSVVRDITERRRAEAALLEAQRRLEHVVASSPAVLLTLTVLDGQLSGIGWISRNIREVFGHAPEAALAPTWWIENVHPEDRDRVSTEVQTRLFVAGRTTHEYRFRHGNGAFRWTRGDIRLMRTAAGEPVEAVGSWSDITEHKLLEEKFLHAQKMEAVGQLAGGVAHDFNNLLTIINGYGEILDEGMSASDKRRRAVTAIRDAGERAAGLTSQLLAFSRRSVLEPRIVSPNEVVAETGRMLTRLIGEDVRLATNLDPRVGLVKVDPGQFGQVLMNLAVNARDAMPTGGRLTIETRGVELDGSYALSRPEVQPGRYALIAVTDTGTGMAPDVKARVFEPFFTTKELGKGTGLGLATVFGIVKQSEGHVEVYSEVGVGTTFKIYLPVAAGADEVPPTAERIRVRGGTESVLLVEDQADVRQLALIALESKGYVVLQSADAQDALALLERDHPHLDVLVTDVVMPGMSGRVLAEAVRVRYPTIKVLFMSGYTADTVVRHGILQADTAFLHKPFTPLSLAQKVREVLDQR